MDDLGVPHFRKPPYGGYPFVYGLIISPASPASPENSRAIALIEAVKRAKNKILGEVPREFWHEKHRNTTFKMFEVSEPMF